LRVLKRKQPQPRKILGGIYRPDAGEFRFNEVAKFAEPTVTDFICAPLVETMSVSENIALVAGYARQGGLISWRETREIR
jgi:ribose transport system ATP-binding protein